MDGSRNHRCIATLIAVVVAMAVSIMSVNGQITIPCTPAMISSFTPCMNFVTGSTGNGSSPTTDCCSSIRSLVSTSRDCACLIVTANVPISLPINRTLAISLPRSCHISGVPLQCKSSAAPLPSPGVVPVAPAPAPSTIAISPSPTGSSESASPSLAPESDPTTDTPAPVSQTPALIPGRRPVLTPNAAAKLSQSSLPALLLVLGFVALKFY